ncbi:MAG: excinuclease ABC subunit UvrC [Lachnospiraceae bacterium]|nr:excinuclease ABC subunit UvrC [Lachnospiraceae bacterium]
MNVEPFDVQEELKKLPGKPGVYIMHDAKDTIIYVGKAVNLKNRVRSYFRESTKKSPKIERMVSFISRFEYIVTDSELEALVLENNLIKEHSPKYNTMLKDDKTYPYIKVTVGEAFPRILFSRQMKKDKSRYYGPYTSAVSVKDTIDLMNKLYCLRTCNRNLPRDIGQGRPCLNFHIKACTAPCVGKETQEEYRLRVNKALEFLNGNYGPVLKELEEKMLAASENLAFEEAAKYRELLFSVRSVAQKQKITNSDGENKDFVGLARNERDVVIQVFFVREGKLIGREHFYMKQAQEEKDAEILQSFLKQFYAGTPFIPKEIYLQETIEEALLIEKWLSQKNDTVVHLRVPMKGQKEKMLDLAIRNAEMILSKDAEKLKREEMRTTGAVKELEQLLRLGNLVRMEAFDISNISGFANVGSMVVFEKGKPKKSDYRKFNIKSVSGPDDYACMKEVLTRRFRHGLAEREETDEAFGSFTRFPDLLLMDGGKGQVNIALSVLDELGIRIPVCGMVKDDNHRTRGLYYNGEEMPIDTHSEGFHLITRIQDEAHRFAIEYHRSLRTKAQVHSVLDEIPGVGPARRKALMKSFASIDELKKATAQEIATSAALPLSVSEGIAAYFSDKSSEDTQKEM